MKRVPFWLVLSVTTVACKVNDGKRAHFDLARGLCINEAGDHAQNNGFEECGLIDSPTKLTALGPMPNFDKKQLRGLVVRDVDLFGASFKGADLRGARFENVDLSGADFSHAEIDDVVFDAPPEKFQVPARNFAGAVTNGNNRFPRYQPTNLFSIIEAGAVLRDQADTASLSNLASAVPTKMLPLLADLAAFSNSMPTSYLILGQTLPEFLSDRIRVIESKQGEFSQKSLVSNSSKAFFKRNLEQLDSDIETLFLAPLESQASRLSFRISGAKMIDGAVQLNNHRPAAAELAFRSGQINVADGLGAQSSLERAMLLIGEARRSDCVLSADDSLVKALSTNYHDLGLQSELAIQKLGHATHQGHLNKNDLVTLADDSEKLYEAMLQSLKEFRQNYKALLSRAECGFEPVECADSLADPSLRGLKACEVEANGSLGVQVAVMTSFLGTCTDCKAVEIERGKIMLADSLSRITRPESVGELSLSNQEKYFDTLVPWVKP
jgi:hypothetical protein